MTDNDNVYVSRIGDAIRQIIAYLREASTDEFARSKMLQDAILRQLEIASRASSDLSLDFRQKNKGVSYGRLFGVEDRIAAIATNKNEAVDPPQSLADVEREHIKKTLNYTGGNRTKAAVILGISRIGLISKIRNYKL